jgi:hypothetical protein
VSDSTMVQNKYVEVSKKDKLQILRMYKKFCRNKINQMKGRL